MTEGIFRDTGQALHVAFLVETLPPSQRSFMQAMIEAHMKACGIWDEAKPTNRTINFGAMSPLEIRGQCAMVRAAVDHHTSPPEAMAIKAHYGQQKTKAVGVAGLVEYLLPLLRSGKRDAALALAWGLYGSQRQRQALSVRAIAEEYGMSKDAAWREQKTIREAGQGLFVRGVSSIDSMFRSSGVVVDEESLQAA